MGDVLKSALGGDGRHGLLTVEVWTARGLATYYALFLIRLSTGRVRVYGLTTGPSGAFMKQVARNLSSDEPIHWRERLGGMFNSTTGKPLESKDSVVAPYGNL